MSNEIIGELIKKYERKLDKLTPLISQIGNTDFHDGQYLQIKDFLKDLRSLNNTPEPEVKKCRCGKPDSECNFQLSCIT